MFWIVVIIAGMTGLNGLLTSLSSRLRGRVHAEQLAITLLLVCLAVSGCSLAKSSSAGLNEVKSNLNFTLTNFTGTSLQGLFLSPSTSTGWEENLLGEAELKDGDTIDIFFNQEEKTSDWDMRIEGINGYEAQWKTLKLGQLTKITLVFKPSTQPVVIAELE